MLVEFSVPVSVTAQTRPLTVGVIVSVTLDPFTVPFTVSLVSSFGNVAAYEPASDVPSSAIVDVNVPAPYTLSVSVPAQVAEQRRRRGARRAATHGESDRQDDEDHAKAIRHDKPSMGAWRPSFYDGHPGETYRRMHGQTGARLQRQTPDRAEPSAFRSIYFRMSVSPSFPAAVETLSSGCAAQVPLAYLTLTAVTTHGRVARTVSDPPSRRASAIVSFPGATKRLPA